VAWDHRAQASPAARGYDKAHRELREQWTKLIRSGVTVLCWRCGTPIREDPRRRDRGWHLGHHDTDRRIIMGPEHAYRCPTGGAGNLVAAAKEARRRQLTGGRDGRIVVSREW
jgi:hypothetical protein